MIRWGLFLGLIGLFGATALIIWSGYEQVLAALQVAGWGIVWTSLSHLIPMIACILGWQALLPGRKKASKGFFLYLLWLRSSVNNLLPVARIGGEIVAVRVMMKHGLRSAPAIASTVVETTTSVIAQFLFVILGLGLFLLRTADGDVGARLLWGVVIAAPLIGGLVYVQKVGVFGLLQKLVSLFARGGKWNAMAGGAARLDRAIRTMYRRRGSALYCLAMQFLSWALVSGEVWLALRFLDHPMSIWDCLMIEALIQAASSAAFIVPAALGVQEAGYLLFGGMLGLPPETAAALAVIRRCRDVLLYVPGLLAWQIQEGRLLVQKRRAPRKHPPAS